MNLSLVLNHACNLRCTYCYTGEKYDRPMPLDVARRAVDFGFERSRGAELILSFFGGEPLLEPALLEAVVDYAVGRSRALSVPLHFSVATNGTLVDERRLALLTTYQFQVQVSLDGGPAAQDANRRFVSGASSWALVSANLVKLRAAGLSPRLVAVIDPATAHLLGESLEALIALGQHEVYFSPNYRSPWDDAACARLETGLRALGDVYLRHFREGTTLRIDPFHGKIVTRLLEGRKPPAVCGFGADELAVAPSGRLYPCDRLVGEDTAAEVCVGDVFGGLDLARRDALLHQKAKLDPECLACELRPRCSRSCGCAQVETGGQVGEVSAEFCWLERAFIAEADRVGSLLFSEKNPAFLQRFYVRGLQAIDAGLA